jgi:uncharacterized PurR-regulated membrane protein YhhQ (DUF165 family)
MGVEDAGIYRLRTATDSTWAGQPAYGRRESVWQRLGHGLSALLRLVFPVVLLVSVLAACYLYLDTKLSILADARGSWLSLGHVLLPATFFLIALTNRRYGASYAFAQVALAVGAIVCTVVFGADSLRGLLPTHAEPTMRFAAAFGGAFFVASCVSILMFDGARGAHWWSAPLVGFLAAAFVFPAIFFPAAYAGTDEAPWLNHMIAYFGLMVGAAIVGLLPYWFLRRMVPPLSGFGGY